jgi:hypothetical protein
MRNATVRSQPNTAQQKKSNRRLWLLGCAGGGILLCAVLGALAYSLLAPTDEPLAGELSFPTTVKSGDTFDFVVTMTNTTRDPIFIKHVVFFHLLDAPFLLDGVKLIGTEPDLSSDLLAPRGDVEYAYFREIQPGESQQVVFHLQADKPATYLVNLGVFAKHPTKPEPAYLQALHITGVQIEIMP